MGKRIIILLFLAAAGLVFAEKDESLDEMVSRADAAPRNAQPALYAKIAEGQLGAADKLYSSGDSNEARAAVDDVVTYSDKAVSAAKESGSHLKATEISLRKMGDKLRAIRRTLAFEDQQPVETAADRLDSLRTQLLARMFDKGKKKDK